MLSVPFIHCPFLHCFEQFGWHRENGEVCITWDEQQQQGDEEFSEDEQHESDTELEEAESDVDITDYQASVHQDTEEVDLSDLDA